MTITRRWQSGLELNSLLSEFTRGIGDTPGNNSILATPKTGTYAFAAKGMSYQGEYSHEVDIPLTYQLRVGGHIRTPDTYHNIMIVNILTIRVGDSILCGLRSNSDGTSWVFYRNGNLGTTIGSHPIAKNTYYHVGIDAKFAASGGWLSLYIDGDLVLNFSGDTTATQVAKVTFGTYPRPAGYSALWETLQYAYYDDLFIDDTTGEGAAAVVPDRRFSLISPDGDGNYSQMMGSDGDQINNSLLVDEIPPSGVDYVKAASTDLFDSYVMADYTKPGSASIIAVIPIVRAKKESVADIQLALGTRLSSTDLIGSDQALGTSYARAIFERQTTKPGGGAWAEADVDGAEVIIKSRGTYA